MGVEIHEDQPLVEPAAAIEGTYADWSTLVWNGDLLANNWDLMAVDNLGNMYIQCIAPTLSRVYDVNGVMTFTANFFIWSAAGDLHRKTWSALGRYITGYRPGAGRPYRVFRDGVEIFSRDPGLDIANWDFCAAASPSPNGRYMGLIGSHTIALRSRLLALYEGV